MGAITETRYKELKIKLKAIDEELEIVKEAIADATALGDLSENEERDSALQKANTLKNDRDAVMKELESATIVEDTSGPRICIGSELNVTKCTADGTPLEETLHLRLDSKGDTVIAKVLGVGSMLGSLVLNGTSGIYKVPNNGGTYYNVEKVN